MVTKVQTVVICPWWEMSNAMTIGEFNFEPIDVAIVNHPALAISLRERARTFCSGYMFPKSEDAEAYMRGRDVPLHPQPTRPTVVVLKEDQSAEAAQKAISMVAFACMSAMDVGGVYTNSAVFESRVLRLVSPATEFTVEVNRRMTGGAQNLYSIRNRIETKPAWCGDFQMPDCEMLDALLRIPPEQRSLFDDAFAALRHATHDVGFIPVGTERAFYALVVTNLLSDIATDDTEETHVARLRVLLDSKVPGGANNIIDAYRSTKLHRNTEWHPKPRTRAPYPFEQQGIVPLNLIYFRVIESIIIARLVDLCCFDVHSKLAAKIRAIDTWIADVSGLAGELALQPTTGAEFLAAKERFEAAASISKRWSDAHLAAIVAKVATSAPGP